MHLAILSLDWESTACVNRCWATDSGSCNALTGLEAYRSWTTDFGSYTPRIGLGVYSLASTNLGLTILDPATLSLSCWESIVWESKDLGPPQLSHCTEIYSRGVYRSQATDSQSCNPLTGLGAYSLGDYKSRATNFACCNPLIGLRLHVERIFRSRATDFRSCNPNICP